jgi:predicted MFS family arabinose efflux permease
MPVGLLPDISETLGTSKSTTGLLMTGYAWLVAIISLPLTLATAAIERKKLLLALLAVFCIGNFLAGLAANYGMMLVSRSFVAFGHSVFWAVTPPLAARLAPWGRYTFGLAAISGGTTLATVLGVPLGTFLGHNFGWRVSFFIVSGVGLAIMAALFRALPSVPSMNAGSLKSLPSLARNKALIACYCTTLFIVTSDFIPYTYLVPYLSDIVGLTHEVVVAVLLIFGACALIGVSIAGKLMDKHMKGVLLCFASLLFSALCGLYFVNGSGAGTVAVMILWSLSLAAVALTFQSWILKIAAHAADAATAVFSAIYNVGIGLGAMLGGIVFDRLGPQYLGFSGALFVIPAIVLMYIFAKSGQVRTGPA